MPAAPVVKWAGGKTKLLPELRARVPKKFNRYYEPFVGGGALFFALEPADAVLGDMNAALIDTYRTLAENVNAVISRLEEHRKANINGYYYEVRDWWNQHRPNSGDRVGAAAAFIFLNKTCFNGLWRENKDGLFNVPKGDYKDPKIFDPDALRAAAAALKAAELVTGEYWATSASAQAGDFVYFDPPYDPVSETSNFTSYTKAAFGKPQQKALAEHAQQLADRGVYVMLSNNDTPFIRELFKGWDVDTVQCARSINSKASKRGAVNEVIITNFKAA